MKRKPHQQPTFNRQFVFQPLCPRCGHGRYGYPYRVARVKKGRAAIHPAPIWIGKPWEGIRHLPDAKPIRLPKSAIRRTWKGVNYAVCAHPFHDERPAGPPPRVIDKAVHHPDLREAKQRLKRALQGKDRR